MADYELKDFNGTAFKNKRKSEEKHPDFTGEVKVSGKLHFLDVWVKKTKAGDNYFSIRIGSEKLAKNDDFGSKPVKRDAIDEMLSDDVPF